MLLDSLHLLMLLPLIHQFFKIYIHTLHHPDFQSIIINDNSQLSQSIRDVSLKALTAQPMTFLFSHKQKGT